MPNQFKLKQKKMFELYEQQKYPEVNAIVAEMMKEFPGKRGLLYNVAYCVQSATGNSERALELMEEAADKGYWSDPDQLITDNDLKPLWNEPRFKSVAERFRLLAKEYSKSNPARLEVLKPDGFNPGDRHAVPLIIALHGNTQSIEDSRNDWGFMAKKGWLVALPQSSQASMEGAFVWNNFETAIPEIKEHFKELTKNYDIDSERIIIAGFSMGGALAASICFNQVIPCNKFILMGPYIQNASVFAESLEVLGRKDGHGYILVGENDTGCLQGSKDLAALCKEHRVECELDVIPGIGHEFPDNFQTLVSNALARFDR